MRVSRHQDLALYHGVSRTAEGAGNLMGIPLLSAGPRPQRKSCVVLLVLLVSTWIHLKFLKNCATKVDGSWFFLLKWLFDGSDTPVISYQSRSPTCVR